MLADEHATLWQTLTTLQYLFGYIAGMCFSLHGVFSRSIMWRNMKKHIAYLALGCFLITPLFGQEARPFSMADAVLRGRTTLAPARLAQLQWIPETRTFSYAAGNKIIRIDAQDFRSDTLAVLRDINAALLHISRDTLTNLVPITWMDKKRFWGVANNHTFIWSEDNGVALKNNLPEVVEHLDVSEKTFHAAYVVGGDLRVQVAGREMVVATREADGVLYGSSVHRDEFGITKGTFWSNDGHKLAFYRMDERMVTPYSMYLLDSMPAQLRTIRYPFSGGTSHHVTIGVFDTRTQKTVFLETGEPKDQYLTNVSWTPDDKYILVAIVERSQKSCALRLYDATDGSFIRTVLEEKNSRWVEPEKPAQFLPGSMDEFLWESERDGYNHLYRYNLEGKMLQQVSAGLAPVTRFLGFDKDGKRCFYEQANQQGLERKTLVSELGKSSKTREIFAQPGMGSTMMNDSGEWFLTQFTSLTIPRQVLVGETKNPSSARLYYESPNPVEGYALGQTQLVDILADDGTILNARMILPPDFNPEQRYPVVLYVYNGPHVQLVTNSWLAGGELWMHRMAQSGIIIFTLDGRGSAYRGFEFESAIHRRLGDLEVADQLAGISFLSSQPFIDTARLGVYGWSYGGFMATSLMSRPESAGLFKCGIAGGPVTDWSMYEIMYTERYMDTPGENPEGYQKSSVFSYIDNLKGRLLMIHGSSDDVVLWQHSLRYIRACVRKGKQIDYFVYPEHKHNVIGRERVHLFDKIEHFFINNL